MPRALLRPLIAAAFACAALSTLFSATADACTHQPPALDDLITASDVVAVGTIVALERYTYTLNVERILGGHQSVAQLTVQRFTYWDCTSDQTPYALGQRMVVFADHKDSLPKAYRPAHGDYTTRGVGREGELRVHDDAVRFRNYALDPKAPNARGGTLKLARLERVVATMRALYTMQRAYAPKTGGHATVTATRRAAPAAYSAAAKSDPLLDALIRRVEER